MTEIIISSLVAFLAALVGSIISVLVIAFPFRWLWNAVMVAEFGLTRVDYVQAVGLLGLVALANAAADGMRIALKFRSPR